MHRPAPRTLKRLLPAILVLLAISADFLLWSQAPVAHTRWCLLSDWPGEPAGRSTVAIARSDDPALGRPAPLSAELDYGQVEELVRLAVERIGGWENLLGPQDTTILIKPNIVEPVGWHGDSLGVNTDWRVVRALALSLYAHDPGLEIIVAEGAGGWARPGTPHVSGWATEYGDGYAVSGYQGMIEGLQADSASYPGLNLRWLDLNYDETVVVPAREPRASLDQDSFELPRTLVEADYVIDAPVMKIHSPGVTVAIKNWVGVLPGLVYGWSKDAGYNGNGHGFKHSAATLQQNIVDLYRARPADLVVVDAVVCREKAKNYWSGLPRRRNLIVAGRDAVSVDVVCSHLMDVNPDDVEHISLARLAGLGQGDLDRIDLAGGTLEQCRDRFIKDDKLMPADLQNPAYHYYGQSNRAWLLKGGYRGAGLEADSLGGEAEAAPAPGWGGWSQPVYFFGDQIDPAAYFAEPNDCLHYAFSYFTCPDSAAARLWVGSRQEVAVWLNGTQVYRYTGSFRVHRLPNQVVPVTVRKGLNRLLVKALQHDGSCEFSLNLCETESDTLYAGNRLAGLEFLPSSGAMRPRGDLDASGALNIFDLLELLRALGQGRQQPEHDLNSSGRVDIFDLLDLLRLLGGN